MAFDPNQLGMAIFLLIAAFFNIWFVITSYRRAFFTPKAKASDIKSIVEVEPASYQSLIALCYMESIYLKNQVLARKLIMKRMSSMNSMRRHLISLELY